MKKRYKKRQTVKQLKSDLEYVRFLLESEERTEYLVKLLEKCLPYVEEKNIELMAKIKEVIYAPNIQK